MSEKTEAAHTDNDGAMPHHPFFDRFAPHSAVDCLDAIDRVACVIDMFNNLNLGNDTDEGLSSRAAYGYVWLSESVRDTLSYTSHRLSALSGEWREEEQEKARYLSAALDSLSTLGNSERDCVLNAMAAQLDVTRSELDAYISGTGAAEAE